MKTENQKEQHDNATLISVLFLILYLLTDFVPSFKTIDHVSLKYFYLAVINIIIGLYIYYRPMIFSLDTFVIFRKSTVFKIYTLFLFFCGISIISAGNTSLALVSLSKLLIVFGMFVNITIVLHKRLKSIYSLFFLFGISVLIQSLIILFDFTKTLDLSAIKGDMGNINILAASLNIKIPFLLLGILHFSNWKRIVLIFAFLLSTIIILLTSSRASFLGLSAQLIVVLLFYKSAFFNNKKDYFRLLYVIVPFIISIVVVNIIFSKIGNSDRYKSVESRITQIVTKESSSQLRIDFWNNALQITSKNPIFGIGIGNWKIESLPYEKLIIDGVDVSGNTHNDFLEIMTETGVVNGLLYFSLFIWLLFTNLKRVFYAEEKNIKIIAILCLMLLLSYFVDAFFNFPQYVPSMQLGFCFLVALTLLSTPNNIENNITAYQSKSILILLTIGVICCFFSYSQFKASQLEFKFKIYQTFYRAKGTVPTNEYKLESKEFIASLPNFPNVSYYAEPFIEYAGIVLYYEKKEEEALKYFKEALKINPYMGFSDWYIHKIELHKGNIENAYKHAKSAFYKRPRNSDFFYAAIKMANEKKDTLEMLKIHNLFTKYNNKADYWNYTATALQLSNYSRKNLTAFVDKGLKEFPKDTVLTAKKDSYVYIERDLYIKQGMGFESKSQFDQAIVYYKKALNEDPNNEIIIQNLGFCYFKLHQFETAKSYLSKIVEKSSFKDGKTEYILGVCYFVLQNVERGCFYLNEAKNKNNTAAQELLDKYCK
ncbi:hypothetical protein B4N84_17265 [Flavobacterium sp. IR1]|nr:hypothetical protein B4N84_17265 [Flavobacterium sp. IR1]